MSASLLLGPPARQAILARVFLDAGRDFYLRELVRRTGLAPRSVQVELQKLVGAGLLTERRDGNRRYVRANASHPLYRPVREIVLKTGGLADVLRNALGTTGVDAAAVYGSIAADRPGAGSDVDLLIVGPVGLRESVRRLRPAADELGREINPTVWSRQEFDRRRSDGDPFLTRLLRGPLVPVVGDWPPPAP
jgi:DNA-binding transcriptional ArsR family regulator